MYGHEIRLLTAGSALSHASTAQLAPACKNLLKCWLLDGFKAEGHLDVLAVPHDR
jgi:hypothetical protein